MLAAGVDGAHIIIGRFGAIRRVGGAVLNTRKFLLLNISRSRSKWMLSCLSALWLRSGVC
eukprot:6852187-Prymnesium_polylepis.2